MFDPLDYIVPFWLGLFTLWLFVCGCAVGSFLNVVIYRLPRGKALTWPSSRCGACLAGVRLKDNVPLLSYLRLRGRCRACGARFSMRYFWVELGTGAVFAGLYWLEIGWNAHGLPVWPEGGAWYLAAGLFPPSSWPFYLGHALLAALLMAAVGCLVEARRLPGGLVAVGAAFGLLWAVAYPWPAPLPRGGSEADETRSVDGEWRGVALRGPMPAETSWADAGHAPRPGFVPWPIWGPLPPFLTRGSFELGLLTGLAGLLGVPWLLRAAGAAQRALGGRDGLSLAAGVGVMAGGFLGWQPLLVALMPATLLALALRRCDAPGFAAALVPAVVLAWLGWGWIGPLVRPALFDPVTAALVALVAAGAAALVTFRRPRPASPISDSSDP